MEYNYDAGSTTVSFLSKHDANRIRTGLDVGSALDPAAEGYRVGLTDAPADKEGREAKRLRLAYEECERLYKNFKPPQGG